MRRIITASPRRALLWVALAVLLAAPGPALGATTYRIQKVSGTMTMTLAGTVADGSALDLRMVSTFTAGPARAPYGQASIGTGAGSGTAYLCSPDCPLYGPLKGTVKVTGALVPPAGAGEPTSCNATVKLVGGDGAALRTGESSVFDRILFARKGTRIAASLEVVDAGYVLGSSPLPGECRQGPTASGPSANLPTVVIPKTRIGPATLTLTWDGAWPVATDDGFRTLSGSVRVKATAVLKRVG